jgi:hypothetical protein
MPSPDRNSIAFIICGALAREVMAIIHLYRWPVDVYGIPAIDHMHPERIAPHVEQKYIAIKSQYEHVLVIYGDCGTRGALDLFLSRHNLERIQSPHCYAMFGAQLVDDLLEEQPGTFFLTDFLVRGFRGTIWRGLGLDRYPELVEEYFRNYSRLVYLAQTDDPELIARAQAIAGQLRLPLDVRVTGFGLLEQRLVEWMNRRERPVNRLPIAGS